MLILLTILTVLVTMSSCADLAATRSATHYTSPGGLFYSSKLCHALSPYSNYFMALSMQTFPSENRDTLGLAPTVSYLLLATICFALLLLCPHIPLPFSRLFNYPLYNRVPLCMFFHTLMNTAFGPKAVLRRLSWTPTGYRKVRQSMFIFPIIYDECLMNAWCSAKQMDL